MTRLMLGCAMVSAFAGGAMSLGAPVGGQPVLQRQGPRPPAAEPRVVGEQELQSPSIADGIRVLRGALREDVISRDQELLLDVAWADDSTPIVEYQIGTVDGLPLFIPLGMELAVFREGLRALTDEELRLRDGRLIRACAGESVCVQTCTDGSGREWCCKYECN